MEFEQMREATSPTEMRAEVFRLRRHNPLVRSVMDMADFSGMSAEDRYTILAYHALKGFVEMQQRLLEQLRLTPTFAVWPTPNAEFTGGPPGPSGGMPGSTGE